MFNGKDFGGNKVLVKKEGDYVINLSQKRERSPSRQVLTLLPTTKVITLNSQQKNQEINLSGQVTLSGNTSVKKQLTEENKELTNTKSIPEIKKTIAVEENKASIKRETKNEETGNKEPVKIAKIESKEVKVDNKIVKEEVKTVIKEEIKEDSVMVEVEGAKFLKIADDTKLHCIPCNKEVTKKSIKAHIISKAHKSLA